MQRSKVRAATVAAAISMSMVAATAHGQAANYPDRPVRIILPFAPGGVVDVMGRLLSKKLTEETGKAFYVDNIGGAGGNIGTRQAAGAPKDGYTILITSSSFVVNPSLHAKVPYDPIKDFAPVTIAAASPNVVVVTPSEPAKTLKELVDSINKNPGKYSFATAGVGTTPHLSGELFKQTAKVDIVHAPFTGAGPALQATMAGHVPISFSGLPPAVGLIKNGSVRALAVTSAKRLETLPDIPTMAEAGYTGQEAETLLFVLLPSGTPEPIVTKLGDMLRKILKAPDVKKEFDLLGFTAQGTSSAESAQRIREELEKWNRVITTANLRLPD